MAVNFVTQREKSAAKKKLTPEQAEIAAMVDRLAELEVILNGVAPEVKEFEKLKKKLAARAEAFEAEDVVTFQGTGNKVVEFSAQEMKRTITDIKGVASKLGLKAFYAIAKVNLTDLDKYLSKEEQADIVKEDRTGSRKFSIKEV